MLRPKKVPSEASDTLRSGLIAHAEGQLADYRAADAVVDWYDFARQIARTEERLAHLRGGRRVTVHRGELPRHLVAAYPQVWAFTVGRDGRIAPAAYS